MGDTVENYGLPDTQSQELRRLLDEIKGSIARLPNEPAADEIREIVTEAAGPDPKDSPDKLATLMNRIKTLASGITGAVDIAESANKIIAISTGSA